MDNKRSCAQQPNSCSTQKNDSSCSTGGCQSGNCGKGMKKSGCCWSTKIKGAIIAGIVIYLVNMIAWTALPFHKQNMLSFKDEKAVAAVIAKNAEQSGIYVLPMVADPMKDTPAVDKPYVYATVKTDGMDFKNMTPKLIREGVLCLVLGALLTMLLKCMSGGCACPVMASAKIGALAGLVATAPAVIWFAFPLNEALVSFFDIFIAFTLAGFVLSKTVLKSCFTDSSCCGKPGCNCQSKGSCGTGGCCK